MMGPVSPYRAVVSLREFEAETDLGPVTLSLSPQSTQLVLGEQVWTVADNLLVVVTQGKRRAKKRSIPLGATRVYAARAWPTNEVSLWMERKTGVVQRILGLPPKVGMSEEVMQTWRDLEKLALLLQEALVDYGAGGQAVEFGKGQNRVLVLRFPTKMMVYARPVFREKARCILTLQTDGSLATPGRRNDRVVSVNARDKVIASGDRINFCHADGENVAGVFLPWVDAADRAELARHFQDLLLSIPQ